MADESGCRGQGEIAFVHFATKGRGAVPYLPVEVRELIFSMTFPHTAARCDLCGAIVLVISERACYFQLRPFKRLYSRCRCMPCAAFAYEVVNMTKRTPVRPFIRRRPQSGGGDGGGGGTSRQAFAVSSQR